MNVVCYTVAGTELKSGAAAVAEMTQLGLIISILFVVQH